MALNNFKIFIRKSLSQKGILLIKISGLVIGMLSSLLILEYVMYEKSFDKGHGEDVYRIAYNRYGEEGLMWETANFFPPAGPYLKATWPEVEDFVTIRRNYGITITSFDESGNKKIFNEAKSYYGTTSFFSVFRIPLLKGSSDCLDKPHTVAISDRAAKKYFGNSDPVDKIMILNEKDTFTVSAVYKTLPENMHIQVDYMFSWQSVVAKYPKTYTSWGGDNGHTYIRLKKGTDYKEFEKKACPRIISDNYADQQKESGERDEIFLQPARSIHLNSDLEYETEPTGNGKAVNILMYFSIFLLIIAWINHINIENAKAIERAREIGIKKTNGSTKSQLIRQFLSESVLFNMFCYLITLVIFLIINPLYKDIIGIGNDLTVFDLKFWIIFTTTVIAGIFIVSIYPAFVLSSFKPVEVLKGKFVHSRHSLILRKTLVTFQFILSIVLITGTLVTYKQVDYLISKDMGVNYKSKLVIQSPPRGRLGKEYDARMNVYLEKLRNNPAISNLTNTSDIPGQEILGWFLCYPKGSDKRDNNAYFGIYSDASFQKCFDIKTIAGRTFREDDKPESNYLIMNLTALKRIGYKTPQEAVNKVVIAGDKEWTIIGVYDDFHYRSVKVEAVPTCFTLNPRQRRYVVLCFDTSSSTERENINRYAKNMMDEIFPGSPYDSFYLEDFMKEDLKTDKTFVRVFGVFSVIALIIALIGIAGLLMIFTLQNMKSFGIRKVLGADANDIFYYLSKQFFMQMIFAILISMPLAWYSLTKWMNQNYDTHIELRFWHFFVPVLIILATLALVMYRMAKKTYKMSVIDVINYE